MNRSPNPQNLLPPSAAGSAYPGAIERGPRSVRAVYQGRLFKKYLLLILSLVTVALLASGAISVYFTYQENKAALASLQREKAIAAASRIEQYVTGIEKQLKFAALPQLDASDVESRRIEFLKVLRQAPEVTDISQLDGTGREQIAVSRLGMDVIGSGKDRSAEPAFKNAKRGQTWFGPVYFRKETEPYMTISIRSGGENAPVTIAEVNLKFIWDVVSRIKIGEKGKAYVVDTTGFLVADPDIGEVLRKTDLSGLPHVRDTAGKATADEPAMLSSNLAGTEVLASMAPIETLNWRVFVEQPVAEVYASLNASILRVGLLLMAGLVLSAIAALALARGMVRPIRTLSDGARRIGEGELDQKIDVRTGDELEALADRFNRMSAQLKESYSGLERKVEERTRELQISLEQQTAISEILRVTSSSPTDVQPVLDAVAEHATRLCASPYARVLLVDGSELVPRAEYATDQQAVRVRVAPVVLGRTSISGRAALDQTTIHHADIVPLLESEYPDARENAELTGFRAVLAVPLTREGIAYGVIFLWRPEPGLFTPEQVNLVETFARQAAIAIDNVRLFNQTKEALEQQTAISEVLRVISSSPGDVRPMLDAVAERALKLCDAAEAGIFLVDAGTLRFATGFGSTPTFEEGERFPLNRGSLSGRAVIDGAAIYVEDLATVPEDEFPVAREMQKRIGHRAALAVPLMRENRAIGAFALWRMEVRAFTEKQIALVKTFSDQAAIAIENVRLFNETKEALAQQTATAEVLKTISRTAFELQPVLETLIENATSLCKADKGVVYLRRGDVYGMVASHGAQAEQIEFMRQHTVVPGPGSVVGLVAQTGQVVHLDDAQTDPSYTWKEAQVVFGFRSIFGVPMLREGERIGVVVMWRREVRPFTPREQALVTTFADQAVIAIQNVRLLSETREALEQQQASGEVLAAISSSIADTSPVFETILQSCERLFAGKVAVIDLIGDDGLIHLGAYHGPGLDSMKGVYPHVGGVDSFTGTAIATRNVVHHANVDGDAVPEAARRFLEVTGIKALIGAPMFWEGKGIGTIWVARDVAGPFSEKDIALLKTFADQAVIAIQNARLVNETREALERQTATAEVLRVISGSVADTAPVFDKILDSCQHLFATEQLGIFLLGDDKLIHMGAWRGAAFAAIAESFPKPIDETVTGMVIRERRTMHIPDVIAATDLPKSVRDVSTRIGNFSCAWAPMLWEDQGVGTICVLRQPPKPLSDKELELLKTFADQAVIAIQNARLFREIQEKSRQLEVANKHKSDFLASMSHELRTPLNAIIGFSEVLLERMFGDLNEKQDDYLKDIHSSGRHLLALINDILDLSKVEAGRMELDLASFDLPAAISNAMTLIRERAQRHGIALGLEVDPQVGDIVADERKVKQILLNLLSNAVKFTPDGGRVDVSATVLEDDVVIAVRDTGIGIKPEDQETMFEAFRQVGADYASKQEGTGLGLALTRKFVELHGGRIWVESAPGVGSTFYFTLPRQR